MPNSSEASLEEISNAVLFSLDGDVYDFWQNWLQEEDKGLIMRLAYPSATDWDPTCSEESSVVCYSIDDFLNPAPQIPELDLDYQIQAKVYTSLISNSVKKDWISGLISRGYYAPVVLHDKSISIHGKPAEIIVSQWFLGLK
jgi:hypothetical protein